MSKFNNSVASLRQSFREYNKTNREDWAALGFRHMTCFVHDDERELILAELDVRKCAAMVAMAENPKTDDERLRLLSRRNLTPLPLTGDLSALAKAIEASTAFTELGVMLSIARNYIKRYRGIEAQFEKTEDNEVRVRMAAKGVAYSAACVAQIRLINATLAFEPKKDTSIFGMKEVIE